MLRHMSSANGMISNSPLLKNPLRVFFRTGQPNEHVQFNVFTKQVLVNISWGSTIDILIGQILCGKTADQCAISRTPAATKRAANQRRRSTFSLRKMRAAIALVTKVSAAAAGATRLTSAQESPTSRLKTPTP